MQIFVSPSQPGVPFGFPPDGKPHDDAVDSCANEWQSGQKLIMTRQFLVGWPCVCVTVGQIRVESLFGLCDMGSWKLKVERSALPCGCGLQILMFWHGELCCMLFRIA